MILRTREEELSQKQLKELSRNIADVRNPENEEEVAYNEIRSWVGDELRATYDKRLALDRLLEEREVLGEKKSSMKTRIQASLDCLAAMKEYDGSLDSDNDAPSYNFDDSDLEYDARADMGTKALQKAQNKHDALVKKSSEIDDRLIALVKDVAKAKYDIKVAEKSHDETWLSVRKLSKADRKAASLRTFLATEHGARYFKHLAKYAEYYRLLPEARSSWMWKHLMNSWGGVSKRL